MYPKYEPVSEQQITAHALAAELLAGPDLPVIYQCRSDYAPLERGDVTVVPAVPKGGWMMRSHPTMSAANKAAEQKYVLFPGN